MSLRTPGLAVEFAVSTMDLYPVDVPARPSWGSDLEQLLPYLEQTGCANFEVVPTVAILDDIAARTQKGKTAIIGEAIGSVHQSFNSGRDALGRVASWRGVRLQQESVADMTTIAQAVGRRIPGVQYHQDISGGILRPSDMLYAILQPQAEVYADLSASTDAQLLAKTGQLGFSGLCPDTVHARRMAKDGTRPPSVAHAWVPQFASGRVYQMHVGADRVDMANRDPELAAKSVQEAKAFTSRHWRDATNTELGELVVAAIENWVPPEDLVFEGEDQPVLRQVLELPPRPRAVLHRVRDHARFVENLAEIARETGATPLIQA